MLGQVHSPDGTLHPQSLAIAPGPNAASGYAYLGPSPQAQHLALQTSHPYGHGAGLPHQPNSFPGGPPGGYHHDPVRFGLLPGTPQHSQGLLPPSQLQRGAGSYRAPHQPEHAPVLQGHDTPASGQFSGLKLIANPPNLEEWRNRLFHVDDMITLTEDQFQTYFPHIDNVYSHRSTQRHKRKRFVSHYWDCRLKGRPPGTKKSTDPDKKKRKRVARERDLCDVKIKIIEYFDAAELTEQTGEPPPVDAPPRENAFFLQNAIGPQAQAHPWGVPQIGPSAPVPPVSRPQKFFTIQRVNGNGGNGKGDGVPGPHKHSLEDSDRVKKNSVMRQAMKNEKEKKKAQGGDPSKKTYHKKATGVALNTVKAHSKEEDLKLFGSCFCPFVQRAWISLQYKGIPYQYIEVDPYRKPQALLDVSPRGLVPAIRHGPTWSIHESTVIMEYLEDLNMGPSLFPPDAQTRAKCRLWTDHISKNIVPCFYKFLQAQAANDQVQHATELREGIEKLINAADPEGPFFLGKEIGFVDVQVAPWFLRLRRVLAPYKGWPEPEPGTRLAKWLAAIENEECVKATTSDDALYRDSYERYAENRPNTSQVADAVNAGRGLP